MSTATTTARTAPAASRNRPTPRWSRFWLGVLSVLAGVIAWWLLSLLWPPTLLPGPAEVADTLQFFVSGPVLAEAVTATAYHLAVGAGLVILVGTVIGSAMGLFRGAATAMRPWVPVLQVIPGVAVMAFALVALGVGAASVILSLFVVGIGYMILNVWHGFDDIDPGLLEMADAFHARRRHVLVHIVAPTVVPYIIAGSRIVVGLGWHVVIFAEFIVGSAGIGWQINSALYLFNTPAVFAWGIVVIVLMVIIDFGLLRTLERWFSRHREAGTT